MKLRTAIEDFLLAGGADGLREKTLIWYGSLLKRFSLSIGNRDLQSITVNDMRQYLVDLRAQQYSADTIHGHIRALHRFWRWCANEYTISNPMVNIRRPKQPKPQAPKAISLTDIIKLLQVCDETPFGRRDKAIIAFLADTGCRAAGLVGLRPSDLDMDRMIAYVIEKGDKGRMVMFTQTTAYLIHLWLRARDNKAQTVFHAKYGKKLSPSGLLQMLKRLQRKAQIKGRVNPHSFRHGFAREYLLSGGDLASLAQILGHEDTKVTSAFYAIFVQDELAKAHRERSPMAKIKRLSKKGEND